MNEKFTCSALIYLVPSFDLEQRWEIQFLGENAQIMAICSKVKETFKRGKATWIALSPNEREQAIKLLSYEPTKQGYPTLDGISVEIKISGSIANSHAKIAMPSSDTGEYKLIEWCWRKLYGVDKDFDIELEKLYSNFRFWGAPLLLKDNHLKIFGILTESDKDQLIDSLKKLSETPNPEIEITNSISMATVLNKHFREYKKLRPDTRWHFGPNEKKVFELILADLTSY